MEDVLSKSISNLVSHNLLKLIPGPRGRWVPSHSLFVEHIMIFYRDNKTSLISLIKHFERYTLASGQIVNQDKSSMYIGSISDSKLHYLSNLLGFKHGSIPFNYLGVLIIKGRPKVSFIKSFTDKVMHKLRSWKGYLLCYASRIELVWSTIHHMIV